MANWLQKKIDDLEGIGARGLANNTRTFIEGKTGPISLDFARKISMQDWLRTVSHCPYSYAYDGTGIAVDMVNRSVILIQHIDRRPVTKAYPFHEIRGWSVEAPSPETVQPIGNGSPQPAMQMPAMNPRALEAARANTGFRVQVRDTYYPEWFIRFESTRTVSTDLSRWMALFNQIINDGAPTPPATQVPPVPQMPPVTQAPPVPQMPPVPQISPVTEMPPATQMSPVPQMPTVTEVPPVLQNSPVTQVPPVPQISPVTEMPSATQMPPVPQIPAETQVSPVPSIKYCPECGTPIDKPAKFCMECGTRLNPVT